MLRRRLHLSAFLLFASLFITACSGHKVTTDYDPDASIKTLREFAVLLPQNHAADTLHNDRMVKALTRHLEAKGYHATGRATADFYVRFSTQIIHGVADNVGFGLGLGTFSGGSGISVGTALRGSSDKEMVTVEMLDPDGEKTLWHGSLADTMQKFKTPHEREKHIQKSIDTLLETFPKRHEP